MLKDLMNEMNRLEQISDELDARWNENPDDADLESKWDEAYRAYSEAMEKVIDYIQNLIHEDRKTIRTMITKYADQIEIIANAEQA